MLRKDKRSLTLLLLLGDGNLHLYKNLYGRITITHGLTQSDYQAWKAKLLSEIFERDVKVRTHNRGTASQVSVSNNRLNAWYKFCYPNNKKDLSRVLKYITHYEMALAVWLMDDGYVEPSKDKRAPNSLSARFRIFTCDQSEETQLKIIQWLNEKFQVNFKIKYAWDKRQNKHYPYLKCGQEDSLKIWKLIREFVLSFKSMQYKFRYIEEVYQMRIVQRIPDRRYNTTDDIVHASEKLEEK